VALLLRNLVEAMAASSDFDFALVEFEGGASAGLSTPGQTVAWLPEEETYLVATFDGDLVSVAAEKLSAYKPPLPEKGGFDVAFPKSEERRAVFTEELLDVLQRKHHCVVQMSSTPTERRAAVNAAEDASDWMRLNPDFETDFLGRRVKNKKLQWASDETPEYGTDAGISASVNALNSMASACIACSEGFGFLANEMSNVLLSMRCSDEEEDRLLKVVDDDDAKVVDSRQIRDLIAFGARRKFCMLYFVSGSGGTLTLHSESGKDVGITCKENQLVVFQNDHFDYTFDPAPNQLCLQAWVLRQPFPCEDGALYEPYPDDVLELIDKIPDGPVYQGGGLLNESVDVMGMSPRMPGWVHGPEQAWAMFTSSTDCSVKVPTSRFDIDIYYTEGAEQGSGRTYACHIGILTEGQLACFDPDFFGMTEEEASRTDPTNRVVLECGYETLHRGGWTKRSLKGAEFGHAVGGQETEWCGFARSGMFGVAPEMHCDMINSALASRLHYVLNTVGPCTTVDTACSSALSALCLLHVWMRPIRVDSPVVISRKQLTYGVAVGASAIFAVSTMIGFCGAGMLSRQGRCFTFDQCGDGFCRGEGQGAMYVKVSSTEDFARLNMICGTCMNQDGRSASMTAPHGPSQQECIRASQKEANISPFDTHIQELHGTGTALGDPIEVGALRATMMTWKGVTRDRPIIKSSAKSNMGHAELAAGIVGIIKCVLMGLSANAAPNLHLRLLNPHIDYAGYPVVFSNETVDQGFCHGQNGVSSFGWGGSNARADVWGRCVSGPRTTNPDEWRLSVSTTNERINKFAEIFGARTDLKKKETVLEETLLDYEGEFISGDPRSSEHEFFVEGSFNGWTKCQKMTYLEDKGAYCFAMTLGDARVERFNICVNQFRDAKLFPTDMAGGMDSRILGPGPAPPGHFWEIDGRRDNVPQGTVYMILFNFDSETRQKKISWEPSIDERALEEAAENCWRHSYSVVGSWNNFKPFPMKSIIRFNAPGLYEVEVKIGLTGTEEFNFVRNGISTDVIYPAQHRALKPDVPVRGPDHFGEKKYFGIVGDTGDRVTINLQVWDGNITVTTDHCTKGMVTFRNIVGGADMAYYICGGWNNHEPVPMSAKSDTIYETTMRMPIGRDCETFHVILDEDPRRAIHPEMQMAPLGASRAVGPDHQGQGLEWAISAEEGARVLITLDMSQADKREVVTWKVV